MQDIYLPQARLSRKNTRTKLFGVGFFIILCILFWWIYNHSYIEVERPSGSSGQVTYELVSQPSGELVTINSESAKIKKLVRKGSYEVSVKKEGSGSMSIVSTKPLLQTTNVSMQLHAEKSREFIGNNPSPCMYYDLSLLYSYECGSSYSRSRVHLPANNDIATTVQRPPNALDLSLESIYSYRGKNVALLRGFAGMNAETEISATRLYDIKSDLSLDNKRDLKGVDSSVSQKITSYKEGFLVYDSAFMNINYYKDADREPEAIKISAPKNSGLIAKSLSTAKNRIAVSYIDSSASLEPAENGKTDRGSSAVQVYEDGHTKSFSFEQNYSIVQLCAEKYLCMVRDRQLEIYNIDGDKPKLLVNVGNVYNLITKTDGMLSIFRYDGVFEFDIENKLGYVEYDLGSYTPCGVQVVQAGGYVLCLINPNGDKVALYIDPKKDNDDSIDKKILTFLNQPYITNVSVYKNFVYISPELGELVYDSRSDNFIYDREIVRKTNQDIDELIANSGIDTSKYTIVNTIKSE